MRYLEDRIKALERAVKCTCCSGGTGGTGVSTLQEAYDGGDGIANEIIIDSTREAVIFQTGGGEVDGDAVFGVANTAGTINFSVTGNGDVTANAYNGVDVTDALLDANSLSDLTNKQTALNNLTVVAGATNEYVLTKDTATGDAVWKAAAGGGAPDMFNENSSSPTVTTPGTANEVHIGNLDAMYIGAGGDVGINNYAPDTNTPNGFSSTGNSRIVKLASSSTGHFGYLMRSAAGNVGLDIWAQGNSANAFIDYLWNASGKALSFRVGTLGTGAGTIVMKLHGDGNVSLDNLPTSSAGLSAGMLWNNSNVVNIV